MRIISREYVQDKLKKNIAKLKQELADLRSSHDDSSTVMEGLEDFGDTLRQQGRRVSRHVADQAQKVHSKAKENPGATFAIAAGIGFLAALLISRL